MQFGNKKIGSLLYLQQTAKVVCVTICFKFRIEEGKKWIYNMFD